MSDRPLERRVLDRHLTPEEAARHRSVRERVERDLPSMRAEGRAILAAVRIAGQLRELRESEGLTLDAMADRTGMPAGEIEQIESGRFDGSVLESLTRYATALGLRLDLQLVED